MTHDHEQVWLQRLQRELEGDDPAFVRAFQAQVALLPTEFARQDLRPGRPRAIGVRFWLTACFVIMVAGLVVHPVAGLTLTAGVALYVAITSGASSSPECWQPPW